MTNEYGNTQSIFDMSASNNNIFHRANTKNIRKSRKTTRMEKYLFFNKSFKLFLVYYRVLHIFQYYGREKKCFSNIVQGLSFESLLIKFNMVDQRINVTLISKKKPFYKDQIGFSLFFPLQSGLMD